MGVSFAVGGFYLAPWIHLWFSKGIPMIAKRTVGNKAMKNKLTATVTSTVIDQTLNSPQCNFVIMTLFGFLNSGKLMESMTASK